MSKINAKLKRLHLKRICRCCLSERGHLRDINATRIPMMMETCASIKVSEFDDLPKHICVSCFHQVAKFYTFKKKIERNDKILRNYIRQKQKSKTKEFSDILHRAVNDAEIGAIEDVSTSNEDVSSSNDDICQNSEVIPEVTYDSEEDIPLSLRRTGETQRTSRLNRKCKQKANRIMNEVSRNEAMSIVDDRISEQKIDINGEIIKTELTNLKDDVLTQLFTDGPPPLIPLASKANDKIENSAAKTLPENAPPLIPIKPLPTLSPAVIVNNLAGGINDTINLKLQCSICAEEFFSIEALKQHRTLICQPCGLQCNICKKEFKERKRLIGHLKGHMVVKDYGCKICGKCYPNPSTFRVHMRTHTGERPFKCQVCNKGFVRWAGVVGHMKTHNSHKPYKCDTCGKGFKISSNLERHKVLHTGILPYCCNYCGKTFSQSDNLQLHIRTYHTLEKPYLCNECGKGFVSSTRLNRHMWVHTGYKPYRCKHCPKAYSNSNDLKNHERVHSGGANEADKPYACKVCDMRFFHPCRLSKHMKIHERPFSCTECPKTFSNEIILNKHMTNKHAAIFDGIVLTGEEVYVDYN